MPLPFLSAVGLGSQAVGSIFGAIAGGKMIKEANGELKTLKPTWTDYQTSQYAKDMLGSAQSNMYARDRSIARAQRGMTSNLATAMGGVSRNSRDSATNIGAIAGLMAQTDRGMGDIADKQYAMDQQSLQTLMNAQNVLVGEDRVKNENMIKKYMMDMERKSQLESMKNAGRQSIVNSFSNLSASALGAQRIKQNLP